MLYSSRTTITSVEDADCGRKDTVVAKHLRFYVNDSSKSYVFPTAVIPLSEKAKKSEI